MNINQHKSLTEPTSSNKTIWRRMKTYVSDLFLLTEGSGQEFEDYIKIPEYDRHFLFFYKIPRAYVYTSALVILEGSEYDKFWGSNYPIQFFFRHTVRYSILSVKWTIECKCRRLKRLFTSENKRHNNLIPSEYQDDSGLLSHVVLTMFANFEKEFTNGRVDWEAMEHTNEFKQWYLKTKHKIEVVLPYIKKRVDTAYQKINLECGHKNNFTYVSFWENAYEKYTTKICVEILKQREGFWT